MADASLLPVTVDLRIQVSVTAIFRKPREWLEPSLPVYGKYGIIKAADFNRMQRSFQVYMSEVKGIASFSGSKWEQQKYFCEFCED